MSAPYFIVLEGIDGSGTTTQCQLLSEELVRRQHDVLTTREPYDNALTRQIRTWLKEDDVPHRALLLAFALDRHIHLRNVVEPALAKGRTVVCDRYALSTWAYQTENNPRELVSELIDQTRVPDLYVLLDVDVGEAAARMSSRGVSKDYYEKNLAFQSRVAQRYRDALGDAAMAPVYRTVEATGLSILETHEAVMEAVSDALGL